MPEASHAPTTTFAERQRSRLAARAAYRTALMATGDVEHAVNEAHLAYIDALRGHSGDLESSFAFRLDLETLERDPRWPEVNNRAREAFRAVIIADAGAVIEARAASDDIYWAEFPNAPRLR
jgi:hypothetical protein